MAKITIEELSGSLKEYLNGLGLSEAQVQELIDKFEDEKIGDISQLSTEEKGSLVGAINELFQSANNGKQIIADAIGSPLTEGDTFAAMGNSINGLTTDFRNALALKGVNAPGDKFETLIRRIEEIVQSGNVLNNQVMISGEYVAPEDYIPRGGYDKIITIDLNLDFDPEYFFIYFSNLGDKQNTDLNGYSWTESVILSTDCPEVLLNAAYISSGYGGSDTRFRLSYDRTTANVTLIKGSYGSYAYVKQGDIIRWYAIGSSQLPNNGGERTITPSTSDQVLPDGYYSGDITVKGDSDLKPENILEGVEIFGVTGSATDSNSLRDSLASILEDEGVSVTEEDDMASLISKVDEEFDNQVIPAVCTNGTTLPLYSYIFDIIHNGNTPTDYEIGYTFFNGYVSIGYSWYTPNNTYGLSHLTFISKDKDGNIIHTSETFDDNTGFPSYYENIKVVCGGKLFARVDTFDEYIYKELKNIVLYCNNIDF